MGLNEDKKNMKEEVKAKAKAEEVKAKEMKDGQEKNYKVPVIERTIAFTKGVDAHGTPVRTDNGQLNMGAKIPVVHYEYDRDNHVLKYGAAIFTVDKKNETFDHKKLEQTAKARFNIRPVVVENFDDDKSLKEFHERVRAQVGTNRVRGPRIKNQVD